jgi:hypothetical protein
MVLGSFNSRSDQQQACAGVVAQPVVVTAGAGFAGIHRPRPTRSDIHDQADGADVARAARTSRWSPAARSASSTREVASAA